MAVAKRPRLEHLRLIDFSDRELLIIVDEASREYGYASSPQIAEALGLGEHGNRMVASRMAWLGRYSFVEKEVLRDEQGNIRTRRDGTEMYAQRWKLTEMGRAIAYGDLRKTQSKMLDGMTEGQRVLLARWLAAQAGPQDTVSWAISREWKHGTHTR